MTECLVTFPRHVEETWGVWKQEILCTALYRYIYSIKTITKGKTEKLNPKIKKKHFHEATVSMIIVMISLRQKNKT